MKPAATLKELLKPPFMVNNCNIYSSRIHVLRTTDMGITKELRDELVKFTVAAMNEKWERDFGEPLRWEMESATTVDGEVFWTKCPKCGCRPPSGYLNYPYCPHCSQRLLPPEEATHDIP